MSNWQEVNSTTDETWGRKEVISGVYREFKTNVGPNNSNMYILDVDGKLIGVWGTTVIDTKMSSVPIGSEVMIEPKGEARSKSGKTYADFKVMFRPAQFKTVDEEMVNETFNK